MSFIFTFIGVIMGVWATLLICQRSWWYGRWKEGLEEGFRLGLKYQSNEAGDAEAVLQEAINTPYRE